MDCSGWLLNHTWYVWCDICMKGPKVVKKSKHTFYIEFFFKILPFMRCVEKQGTVRQAIHDNIMWHRNDAPCLSGN